jgi:hypothetical protein
MNSHQYLLLLQEELPALSFIPFHLQEDMRIQFDEALPQNQGISQVQCAYNAGQDAVVSLHGHHCLRPHPH